MPTLKIYHRQPGGLTVKTCYSHHYIDTYFSCKTPQEGEGEWERKRETETERQTHRDREQNTFSWFKNIHQQDDTKPGSEYETRLNLCVLLAVLHCKSR